MKKNFNKIKKNGGAAMLISVIFFLFISLAIISGLVSPTVREFNIATDNIRSKQSYFLSESGAEDAYYRLKDPADFVVSSPVVINLNGNAVTTDITDGYNQKIITSTGDVSSRQRINSLTLSTGAGVGFNYGVQAGEGGFTMDGGSSITGNVYSNGNINATNGVTITGTAVSASNATLVLDQTNETPIPPSNAINFRNVSASQDFAQSFKVSSSSPIYKIQFYIKKVGTPSNANIYIVTDNNGSPSTTKIAIGTVSLPSGQVTTNFGWLEILLPTQPSLTPGTTYWVVIDNSSQSASNYYVLGANNLYTLGVAKTGAYSGSWATTNLDGYFKIYAMQGVTSLIGGDTNSGGVYIGSAGIGDAWATIVQGATVAGHLYCQIGYNNNKDCDTSHGAPPPQPMPFSEANIQAWKDEGTAGDVITGATKCHGGYSGGNCTVDYAGATFGPGIINGNLTVNGGGTLTMTGTVYVKGTVTVTGGGKITLPANFNQYSATLVSDSYVLLNGGSYTGSGAPGSYLFVVTTSSANPAITVSGGSGTIAVCAQDGTVALSGGISINAAIGKTITMTGGTHLTYQEGLASPSFESGPSGGWVISGWEEQ